MKNLIGTRRRHDPIRLAVLVLPYVFASYVLAWGGGHVDLQRAIVDHLPKQIVQHVAAPVLEQSIRRWSKYPDSFESFEAESELIGPTGMATLQHYGVKSRYDLHHDWGRAVGWICLVEALREKRYDAAVFWIACLGHSAGDMVGANHDPLAHYATYDWPGLKQTHLPRGAKLRDAVKYLDLHAMADDPAAEAIFEQTINAMRLKDDGRSSRTAMLDIMMYGYEGAAYCGQRGDKVVEYAVQVADGGDDAARRELWKTLGELGAWAAVRILRDVEVALRAAAQPEAVAMTDDIRKAYQDRVDQWIGRRSLDDQALFGPILRPASDSTRNAVGVVLEPGWRFNEGLLGFHARLIATSVAQTLASAQRPYVTLDVRTLATQPWPDPDRVSIVIVVASQMSHRYHTIDGRAFISHMTEYLKSGGRVLWVAGQGSLPRPALDPIAAAVTPSPVSSWPVDPDELPQWHLQLTGAAPRWSFTRSPQTSAGWQRPFCAYRFDSNGASVVPLIQLTREGTDSITVGVLQYENNRAVAACLPIYALHPMLLEQPAMLDHTARPQLDAPARTILFHVLDQLNK